MTDAGIGFEERGDSKDEIAFDVEQEKMLDVTACPVSSGGKMLDVGAACDDEPTVRRVTWSGKGVAQPKELIEQLRNRQIQSQSQSDLSAAVDKPSPPARRVGLPGAQDIGVAPRRESAFSPPKRPMLPIPHAASHQRGGHVSPNQQSPPFSPPSSPAPSPVNTPDVTPPGSLFPDRSQRPCSARPKPQKPLRTVQARARHTEILQENALRSPTTHTPPQEEPSPSRMLPKMSSPSVERGRPALKPRPVPRTRAKTSEDPAQERNGQQR